MSVLDFLDDLSQELKINTAFVNLFAPFYRGNSLKKRTSTETPKITISRPPRPESLTFEFENDHARATKEILPDEITRELEALSQVDLDDRNSRIAKLEKLRRKGEFDSDEEDANAGEDPTLVHQDEDLKGKSGTVPESAESSVEGKIAECSARYFANKSARS